jgi:hypothetical protein
VKRLVPVVAILALSIDAKTASVSISTVHLASRPLINVIHCTGCRLVMYLFCYVMSEVTSVEMEW